jgi:hypothetical protein
MEKSILDLKDSKLILEGSKEQREKISDKIDRGYEDLKGDKSERRNIYKRRKDFFIGNQGEYSNITGLIKDTKQKKGHTNQVTNYAGKTVVKIAFGIANNPPKISVTPNDINDEGETIRSQAVEDYQDLVFNENKFWKSSFRRGAFIQAEYGDAAIKTFVIDGKIKIINHEDMGSILVGWNGNPGEYDFVIVENYLTPQSIYEQFGIKVDLKFASSTKEEDKSNSGRAWEDNGQWNSSGDSAELPSGRNKLPKARVLEYDSLDAYAIKIEGELVEYIIKDDDTFPRVKFWTIIPNVPNSPSPWSIADIDYLIDPQIELNDNDNRTSDHLRVGNVQRYVATNISDFDPESLRTSSGQVIFVSDPDGRSRFEPLPTNINNFPDDQYNSRKIQQMYDMGLPKVNYGASGADSGRSKAIDYQSSIDLTTFKRDAWELALQDICEKIQTFGNFLLNDKDWFKDSQGNFVLRQAEFDWTDILPLSQSDKIVNIANKFNMIGIPLDQALKELGYRNPAALIEKLKTELSDPNLMILRSKAWQLSQGILEAQAQAAVQAQSNMTETPPPGTAMDPNAPSPTLNSSENTAESRPMASKGGTTSYASGQGLINKATQNFNAARGG